MGQKDFNEAAMDEMLDKISESLGKGVKIAHQSILRDTLKYARDNKISVEDYTHHKARMLAEWMTEEGLVVKGKDVITPIFLMLQNHFIPKPPQP